MFKFGSSKYLCITRGEKRLQLLEAQLEGDKVTVTHFGVIPELDPNVNKAADQLRDLLAEKKIKTKNVYAGLQSENIKFKRIVVPMMGKQQLTTAVKQALVREFQQPIQNLEYTYRPIQDIQDKGIRRQEILISGIPKQEMQYFEDLLVKARLKPVYITPIRANFAYYNITRSKDNTLPNEVQAFVYISPDYSVMSFLQEGWFVFSRGFITPKMEEEEEEDLAEFFLSKNRKVEEKVVQPADNQRGSGSRELSGEELFRVGTEISRSMRFFQQNFRNYDITQLILCGRAIDIESLKGNLGNVRFTLHAYSDLAQAKFPKSSKYSNVEKVNQYTTELSLLWGRPQNEKLNFLPPPSFLKKYKYALAGLWMVVFTLMLLFLITLQIQKYTVEPKLERLQNSIRLQEARLNELRQSDQNRQVMDLVKSIVDRSAFKQQQLENYVFKKISVVVPDEMMVEKISVSYKDKKWAGTIDGKVIHKDANQAKRLYQLFLEKMKQSPLFKEFKSSPIDIAKDKDEGYSLRFNNQFTLN